MDEGEFSPTSQDEAMKYTSNVSMSGSCLDAMIKKEVVVLQRILAALKGALVLQC